MEHEKALQRSETHSKYTYTQYIHMNPLCFILTRIRSLYALNCKRIFQLKRDILKEWRCNDGALNMYAI